MGGGGLSKRAMGIAARRLIEVVTVDILQVVPVLKNLGSLLSCTVPMLKNLGSCAAVLLLSRSVQMGTAAICEQ